MQRQESPHPGRVRSSQVWPLGEETLPPVSNPSPMLGKPMLLVPQSELWQNPISVCLQDLRRRDRPKEGILVIYIILSFNLNSG